MSEQYFREGVGVTLNSGQLAQATQLQDEYVYNICRQAGGFNVETAASPSCTGADWTTFTVAGMNDIDQRCDAYLDWLDAQRRDRTPVLAQIAAMGAATAGIMGVAGAGTEAIAIAATAFGLAGQSYANWNSRLLLDVDHSTVQALVYRRQQQYRQSIYNIAVPSRASAIYLLRGYLRLCMPITIETDINNTVTLAQSGVPASVIEAPLVRPVGVTNVVTEVRKPLATPHRLVNTSRATTLTPIEAGLTGVKIEQIQRALCVASPSNDLGGLDSSARIAMSEFFEAGGFGPSQTIKNAKMLNKLQDAISKVGARNVGGTCAKAGFDGPRAVGEAVKKPLTMQPAPTKLTPLEAGLTGDKIEQIQRALCVASPSNDLGGLDSETRKNMSEFFEAAGLEPSQTIKDAKMINKLEDAITKVGARSEGGTCVKAGFDSPRAVGEAVKRGIE